MIFIIWLIEILFITWLSKIFPIYFHNHVLHPWSPKIDQRYLDAIKITKQFNNNHIRVINYKRKEVLNMSKYQKMLLSIDQALNQPAIQEDQEVVTWWNKVAGYYTGDFKYIRED